jgi:hypothetical protein
MTRFKNSLHTNILVMLNKYKEGDTVFAKENPTCKLIVRRYVDTIYYCREQKAPEGKELVYFERELISNISTQQN